MVLQRVGTSDNLTTTGVSNFDNHTLQRRRPSKQISSLSRLSPGRPEHNVTFLYYHRVGKGSSQVTYACSEARIGGVPQHSNTETPRCSLPL